jgi:hypothetical protein
MDGGAGFDGDTPITYQGDLAKLPAALAPLLARPQWCVWKWSRTANGTWQKPPYMSADPSRHASTADPSTWCSYADALAVVQASLANGLTYVLTPQDPFGAADLDHCRDPQTSGIAIWAQQLLDQADAIPAYYEISPSGAGMRIWGAVTSTGKLHTNRRLEAGGGLELFRATSKALTVTGLQQGSCRALGNIDALLDRAAAWVERRKDSGSSPPSSDSGSTLARYGIEDIERAVREGAPESVNRSDLFHAIVGHYWAVGWNSDQIAKHFEKYPDGLADKFIFQGRLLTEIGRCLDKWQAHRRAQELETSSWTSGGWQSPEPPQVPAEPEESALAAEPEPAELDPDETKELGSGEPQLPPMYCHGDPDPRPLTAWLIKDLLASVSYGVLAGQWGSGKTFVVLDLAACLMTGRPFVGHRIKRQCGVLFIAAEGVNELRRRLTALVREKCGGMRRAPFRWYEAAPTLLKPDAAPTLIAMARQAEASLQAEFGLPLGLIVIDTVAASAGYAQQGAESDAAVAGHILRVFAQVAEACCCVVLGVDHFGKNPEGGTRGSSAKESNAELVLACLGERELSGQVRNTRLAVRKNKGGPQGQEYPFALRVVELGLDEDGDPITTMVVDWQTGAAAGSSRTEPRAGPAGRSPTDVWEQERKATSRQALVLLKRVLMSVLAKEGTDLPSAPDGPAVRMVDREIVREEFYARTAADGTPEQKREFRRQRFYRAVSRAEEKQLIGIREIGDTTYFWLASAQPDEEF